MNNKHNKLAIGIGILFEIILITTVILNIFSKEFDKIYLLFIAIICFTLPFIITHIANKKNLVLPSNFELNSLIFLILTLYFGEIKIFYTLFGWWDLFLHGMFGSYAAIIGLSLTQGIILKEKKATEKRFAILILIFAFSFSIALGTLWEMFEFVADYFFKADMVNGGLEDTATDLIINILLAFITCIICYFSKFKNKQ